VDPEAVLLTLVLVETAGLVVLVVVVAVVALELLAEQAD
jgi:hypothetical protein